VSMQGSREVGELESGAHLTATLKRKDGHKLRKRPQGAKDHLSNNSTEKQPRLDEKKVSKGGARTCMNTDKKKGK